MLQQLKGLRMSQKQSQIDWSQIPEPQDDGAAQHLAGMSVPAISLPSTHGDDVMLTQLTGSSIIYIYPMTGNPDGNLPEGWDQIPGARGCTPQSCAFRDHYDALRVAGAFRVFGLSTQTSTYQAEAAKRLELPFPLLSDPDRKLGLALKLPTFEAAGSTLYARMTLILRANRIVKSFYPVFPPDQNAQDVLNWLTENPA